MSAARRIGDIIAKAAPQKARRTFQPVRANSYNVGEREKRFYRPINPREISARLRAAQHYDWSKKQPGARNGPLGHIGLELLREFYRLICHRTGRLEPSIDYLMRKLKRSRDAIVRAKAALKEHGFLEWMRRVEPTENEGAGPQIRQISNAYRLAIPAAAEAIVRSLTRRPPPPDDDTQRRQEAALADQEMLASLEAADYARAVVSDRGLADVLARLGDAVSASPPGGQNPT